MHYQLCAVKTNIVAEESKNSCDEAVADVVDFLFESLCDLVQAQTEIL